MHQWCVQSKQECFIQGSCKIKEVIGILEEQASKRGADEELVELQDERPSKDKNDNLTFFVELHYLLGLECILY